MKIHKRLGLVFSIVMLTLSLSPFAVQADSGRITEGDVQAVLQAFMTGGRTVVSNSSETAGFHAAPADFLGSNGAIMPFAPWDNQHICVSDWHVLLIGLFDGGDTSYTRQDTSNHLSQLELSFTLDGDLLQTTRTAIKRFHNPAPFLLEEAYGFQVGSIMAPGDLEVGEHVFEVDLIDPIYGDDQFNITFFVDDASSMICN